MKNKYGAIIGVIVLFIASVHGVTQESMSDKEKEIRELIGALGQTNWQNAVDRLADIGEPAVEPLIRTLKDKSIKTWVIHARAINALTKIGTQEAVEAVIESLEDKESNEYVRGSAALAVAEMKPKEAVEVLAWAFTDGSWLVRLRARTALLQIGQSAVERLVRALNDENPHTRWQAAWVLGRIKSAKAIEPLVAALADSDWMVRDEAAVALVRINSNEVFEPLAKALEHQTGYVRTQAAWVLSKLKSDGRAGEFERPDIRSRRTPINQISYNDKTYPCYPQTLDTAPDIPSPYSTKDGIEVVTAVTKDKKYALIPVTVENGRLLDYSQRQWGKGRQLYVDAADFPTLAATGLHCEAELDGTKMITGRSIVEITELGRPRRSSGAGFMSDDEDIVSVLRGDNRLVKKIGLTHPQMARPLFQLWNMILKDIELQRLARFWDDFGHILYYGRKVFAKAEGARGWQESLFDDEVLGMYQFEISRELDQDEKAFLYEKYSRLSREQMAEFVRKLSFINTGEMVPYYIMRYGFYEGHTDYRADPIAIAWIFGLKSLEEIEAAFEGKLYESLMQHFARGPAGPR
jgi:hypothetical protein